MDGVLIVIDRLGRAITELEARNAALEEQVAELQKQQGWPSTPAA